VEEEVRSDPRRHRAPGLLKAKKSLKKKKPIRSDRIQFARRSIGSDRDLPGPNCMRSLRIGFFFLSDFFALSRPGARVSSGI